MIIQFREIQCERDIEKREKGRKGKEGESEKRENGKCV